MANSTGLVTATKLNVRETPDTVFKEVGELNQDDRVDIISLKNNWYKIAYKAKERYVKASFIRLLNVPPRIDAASITQSGNDLFAFGVKFGRKTNYGIFSGIKCSGSTPIAQFLADNPNAFPNLSASMNRVANAVAPNEGNLEAVNSYDSAFISFGTLQWTAGSSNEVGELPSFLARLKRENPQIFDFYFGQYGLDIVVASETATTGRLKLNGTTLMTAESKQPLRTPIWAHRFWRAGHDYEVRRVQVEHAMGRLRPFYSQASNHLGGHALQDWITSELGVAHLLDQHTNRPGHVPSCIAVAINERKALPGKNTPDSWTSADELAVLARYIELRKTFGGKPMTDSTTRANRIIAAADAGKLSAQRGSFVE